MLKGQLFLLIFVITYLLCYNYPINEKIVESERGDIKSINIDSTEDYINYIKTYNNIISLFHVDWCGHCQEFLPVLDKASSYKIVNKNWIFLKISCTKYPHICSFLGIHRYPTIKIYRQKEPLHIQPPRDLAPLLAILQKLSSNPIINIKSKEDFIEKYGDFSPIIEILTKSEEKKEENDFFECIKQLANNDFVETFYFGVIESKDNIEKIVFNYNISNISYIWDGNCTNASNFLYDNKYPLLSKINEYFLKEIADDPHILIFLITFPQNKKINDFIFTFFQKMSFENRKYVFGYADFLEDKDISKFFKLKLNNTNEIKLIIYDFNERMYYIHNITYNIILNNEKEIINDFEKILKNINNLKYTSGSIIRDWVSKIGFDKMSANKQVIVVGIIVFLLLGIIFLCFHFSNPPESDFDEEDDELEENSENNNKENELNKNVKQKIE